MTVKTILDLPVATSVSTSDTILISQGGVTKQATVALVPGTTGSVSSVGATAPLSSTGGANPTISIVAATTSVAGSMSAADKLKLDGISGSNSGDNALNSSSAPVEHVGAGGTAHPNVVAAGASGFMTGADKTKLDNITGTNTGDQTNITGNAGTATVLQTARTINGVNFNGSANITINAVDSTARVASSLLGTASGVATLDGTGKVPSAQLPSFVDDVLEFANLAAFPGTGAQGVLYVALDTNKVYRWSGSVYIYITSGAVDSVAGKTGVVTLVKADVGLGSVDNTADNAKPVSSAQATAIGLKIDTAAKDASSGVPGLTQFKLNLRNALNTITSFFTTSATVARTWTMPDKDGTVAMTSDITGVNSGTNTGDNAANNLYSGLVTNATHTGDVTGSAALTIAANAVTNAKAAQMAVNTIKGRITAGTGNAEDLTAANVRTILNVADGANNYALPVATPSILGGVKVGSGLTVDGAGVIATVGGSGAPLLISTNTTAVAGSSYVMTAALNLTLPASPAVGSVITFQNASGVPCTVLRNGQPIMGLAEDLTLDLSYSSAKLVYTDATLGWSVTEITATQVVQTDWPTVTNKPTTLSGYGITGTLAQFNTAVTDADLAPTASPTFSGDSSFPGVGGSGSSFVISNGTGDGASTTTYNTYVRSWWGIGFRDYQNLATVKAYIDCRAGIFAAQQFRALATTGTAPMEVFSTTVVPNLNADMLDGQHGSYYAPLSSPVFTGTPRVPALFIGPDSDLYLYESAANAMSIRHGASGAYKYTTFLANGNLKVETGTLEVSSTALVTNLNADLLDGQHGSYYAPIDSPVFANATNSSVYSSGNNGWGAFYSRGSGTNWSYHFFGNVTSGELNRISSSSTGEMHFGTGNSALTQMLVGNVASAVNYVRVQGAVTGGAVAISAQGSDANVSLNLVPKGTGAVQINGSTAWHAGNDGASSGLDADLLDGQQGSYYQNADNLNAGTIPAGRFPSLGLYSSGSTDGSYISNGMYWNAANWRHLGTNTYGYVLRNSGVSGAQLFVARTAGTLDSVSTHTTYTFAPSGRFTSPAEIVATGGLNIAALAVPGQPTGTPSTTGGTILAGTHFARIVALDVNGNATTPGVESALVTTTGSTSSIVWSWGFVPGAVTYFVFVGATGAQGNYFTTTATSYTQTAPASTGTAQAVSAYAANFTGSITVPGHISAGQYVFSAYLNMSHAASARTADTTFYSSNDNYVRKNTAAGFKQSLALQNVTNESKATMFASPAFTGQASVSGAGGLLPASTTMAAATGNTAALMVQSQGTAGTAGAAFMSFHRPGNYAAHIGLDTDNFWKVGGWSMGAVAHKLWHAGSDGAGSGLDADLIDGIDSTALIYGTANNGTNIAPVTWSGTHITQYKSGFFEVTGAAWTPTTGYWWGINTAHASNSASYIYGGQIIFENSATPRTYVRVTNGGATPGATAWQQVLTTTQGTYAGTLTSGQITTALGYTPSNPGGLTVSVISTNTTAVAGTSYVLIATLDLTLPASPTSGAQVKLSNRSASITCRVLRNGQNIMNLAEDMTIDDLTSSVSLVFADATRGWVIL